LTTLEREKRKTLVHQKQRGRCLSFALGLRASTGALTGSRAELLDRLFSLRGLKEQERKELVRGPLASFFGRGIGRRASSLSFSSSLSPTKQKMACTALYFMSLRGDVLIARTYRDEAE